MKKQLTRVVLISLATLLFTIASLAHTKGDFGVCGSAADPAVFRPGNQNLYYLSTCSGSYDQLTGIGMNSGFEQWLSFNDGGTSDVFADFSGTNNRWNVFDRFGGLIDTSYGYYPVGGTAFAGDVNGDGHDDYITYYQGVWTVYIKGNHFGTSATYYLGDPSTFDKPVVGDFNGDGKVGLAVFKPRTGKLLIYYPNDGHTDGKVITEANTSVKVFAADIDGDGKDEMVSFFQPSAGDDSWTWRFSGSGLLNSVLLGTAGIDIPVPGDYLGQGKEQLAVYRTTTGQWFAGDLDTFNVSLVGTFGASGDIPVQGGRVH